MVEMHALEVLWQKDDLMDLETLSVATKMPAQEIQQPKQEEVCPYVSNQIGHGVVPLPSQMGAIARRIQLPSCTYQPAIQVDSMMFT